MLGLEMFIRVRRKRISILFLSNYIVYMHKPSYTKQPENRKPKSCNVFLYKTAIQGLNSAIVSDSWNPLCSPGSHGDIEPSHMSVRSIRPCLQALQANEAITIKTGHVYFD